MLSGKTIERIKLICSLLCMTALSVTGVLTVVRNDNRILKEDAEKTETALADGLPLRSLFLEPSRAADSLLRRKYFGESRIYLNPDGIYLQGSVSQKTDPAYGNIMDLYLYCAEHDLNFLYVVLPGKPSSDTDLTQYGISCARNQTADEMLERLRNSGVPCMDARELFRDDFYDMFYRTDYHWTADAGLRTSKALLEKLNGSFGYRFDTDLLDADRFRRTVYPDFWVGEIGQKVLDSHGGKDDLILLEPEYPVHLNYRNLTKDVTAEGGFEILTYPQVLDLKHSSPYYYYLGGNDTAEIGNTEQEEGNLLLIKDSFSNLMVPFLSLAAEHITAWDMRNDPDICSYLEDHPETETVILAYNISFVPTSRMNDFRCPETESDTLQMEYLDRGTVAVKTDSGVFLSWRLLGTEAYDTVFEILRNGEIIASVGDRTNMTDPEGTAEDIYTVRAVGETDGDSAAVLPEQRLGIPLDPPVDEECTYTANDAACADLDGDGRYELILKWEPSNAFDSGEQGQPTGNVYIDAYRLDGTRLWRMDLGTNIPAGAHFTQIAAYDFDLDGKAELAFKTAPGTKDGTGHYVSEVSLIEAIRSTDNTADLRHKEDGSESYGRALCGDEYYTVFCGETGEALDTVYYPFPRGDLKSWGDDRGNRSERYLCAAAYLDGIHPNVITWRGYYGRTTAAAYRLINKRLVLTDTFDSDKAGKEYEGQGGHSLSVGDADNDGRDEIFCGSLVLDDDLSVLWCSERGHGDAQHLADYDPEHPGPEYFCVHETAPYGMTLYDAADGTELFHSDGKQDTGRGMMAHTGLTDGYCEFWSASGTGSDDYEQSAVYASFGGTDIRTAEAVPSSENFRIFWNGDLYDELLDGTEDDRIMITDKAGREEILPEGVTNNGTKHNVCLSADLFGDWREEIVVRSEDSRMLWVYTTVIPSECRMYTLMHDRTYRMQAAAQNAGYSQPPHTGYVISEDDRVDQRAASCRIRTVHDGKEHVREP
ncbi:MAG: hypothetical protein IKF51_00485 [Solobacterium sp.]|nr:hypothetical protein [Solobacterium sp.]